MFRNKIPEKYRWIFPLLVICALLVIYFSGIVSFAWTILLCFDTLIAGVCIAYVMNLLKKALERIPFPKPKTTLTKKIQKVTVITLSFLLVIALVFFLVYMVVPSLTKTVQVFLENLPKLVDRFKAWVEENKDYLPGIADSVRAFQLDMTDLSSILEGFLPSTTKGIVSTTFSAISTTFTYVYEILMAMIFALYVLYNKDTLKRQIKHLARLFIPARPRAILATTCRTANQCFSSFIEGQCIQALILGVMCVIFMLIFGFPEPVMISIFVGATAVIPLVGSYLGSIVGALIVSALAPRQTIFFIIYIFCLQQFVASVIYPKVVGKSVGLPGMWVMASVVVGGAFASLLGMVFGVPTAATLYHLLKAYTANREEKMALEKKEAASDKQGESEAEEDHATDPAAAAPGDVKMLPDQPAEQKETRKQQKGDVKKRTGSRIRKM